MEKGEKKASGSSPSFHSPLSAFGKLSDQVRSCDIPFFAARCYELRYLLRSRGIFVSQNNAIIIKWPWFYFNDRAFFEKSSVDTEIRDSEKVNGSVWVWSVPGRWGQESTLLWHYVTPSKLSAHTQTHASIVVRFGSVRWLMKFDLTSFRGERVLHLTHIDRITCIPLGRHSILHSDALSSFTWVNTTSTQKSTCVKKKSQCESWLSSCQFSTFPSQHSKLIVSMANFEYIHIYLFYSINNSSSNKI